MEAGDAAVEAASEELFEISLECNPFLATFVGIREAASLLPELSESGVTAQRERLDALRERLRGQREDGLSNQSRITLIMMRAQVTNLIASLDARRLEYSVSPITSTLPATALLTIIPKTPVADPADAHAYLTRCSGISGMLDATTDLLGEGLAKKRPPVRRLVESSLDQIQAYLASGAPENDLGRLRDSPGGFADAAWQAKLLATVKLDVRPALARYAQFLRVSVLRASRPDNRAGLCWIPGGDESYSAAIAEHTTLDTTAEAVHALGLETVEVLKQEARGLGESAFGTSNLAEIRSRLRSDPALYFTTSDEIVATAIRSFEIADAALPQWVDRLPRTKCEIRVQPYLEAQHAPFAYYRPGDLQKDLPGIFWVNTHEPSTHARFEVPATCAHETVPGHHVQWSLAREAESQSRFRRYAVPTSFIEGWALYCERFGDELGLYEDDIARLGRWSLQSWRAARLVIDTGIHALGWSRERSVEYLRENTVTSEHNIQVEVDRYIGNPGQALSYMVGGLHFARLREKAEKALGSRFRPGEFHLRVLENGALPLHALSQVVDEWLVGKEG